MQTSSLIHIDPCQNVIDIYGPEQNTTRYEDSDNDECYSIFDLALYVVTYCVVLIYAQY